MAKRVARSAITYRAARRNEMRRLKMSWADFKARFPANRPTGLGKREKKARVTR